MAKIIFNEEEEKDFIKMMTRIINTINDLDKRVEDLERTVAPIKRYFEGLAKQKR